MQKITPHLWFDNNAEEAAKFYTSIFKNSKILDTAHYGESAAEVSGRPKGTVMTVKFEVEGQRFMALNGGPVFKFSPAISFFVNCETQEEVDDLWEKLSSQGLFECGNCRVKTNGDYNGGMNILQRGFGILSSLGGFLTYPAEPSVIVDRNKVITKEPHTL